MNTRGEQVVEKCVSRMEWTGFIYVSISDPMRMTGIDSGKIRRKPPGPRG